MPKSPLLLQRRRDFLRACLRAEATERGPINIASIAHRAMHTPAPGYYVEFESARKVLYTYFSTGRLPAASPHRRAMWLELIDRVKARRDRGWNITDALQHVLTEGRASQYFIAESTACRELRSHHRRKPLKSPPQAEPPSM